MLMNFISLSNKFFLSKTTVKFKVIIINFHFILGIYHVYSTLWSLSKTRLLSFSLDEHFAWRLLAKKDLRICII